MAVGGNLGTLSSFSQRYVGRGMPSSELQVSVISLPTSRDPWILQSGADGGTAREEGRVTAGQEIQPNSGVQAFSGYRLLGKARTLARADKRKRGGQQTSIP